MGYIKPIYLQCAQQEKSEQSAREALLVKLTEKVTERGRGVATTVSRHRTTWSVTKLPSTLAPIRECNFDDKAAGSACSLLFQGKHPDRKNCPQVSRVGHFWIGFQRIPKGT